MPILSIKPETDMRWCLTAIIQASDTSVHFKFWAGNMGLTMLRGFLFLTQAKLVLIYKKKPASD
jgi:hypothetical protein